MQDPTTLITSASQLSSANDGMANYRIEEVSPRPLPGRNDWYNKEIRYSYSNNGSTRSMEGNTYLRGKVSLTKSDGVTDLDETDFVAPGMNPLSALFRKVEWLAGGQTITSVNEFIQQVSTLETRQLLSGAQLDRSDGSALLMSPYFEDRSDIVIRSLFQPDNTRLESRGKMEQVAKINSATDTVAVVGATGVITWVDAAGGDLDLTLYFKVGDYISFFTYSSSGANPAVALPTKERVFVQLSDVTATTLTVDVGVFGKFIATNNAAAQATPDLAAATINNALLDIRKVARKQRSRTFEVLWKPPLGIFKSHIGTPAGDYELVFQTESEDKATLGFIESVGYSSKTLADVKLTIEDMFLYIPKFEASFVKDQTILFDLMETRCQQQPIDSAISLQQKTFVVPPTSSALTLAFQSDKTLADTRYSATKFKIEDDLELKLRTFYIQYAGQQRPQRQPDLAYDDSTDNDSKNTLKEFWYRTIDQNRSLYESGSGETFEEWRDRGAYYLLNYPRSGEDRATVAQVFYEFSVNPQNKANVLLFSHSRKVATLSIKDGRIEKVSIDYV